MEKELQPTEPTRAKRRNLLHQRIPFLSGVLQVSRLFQCLCQIASTSDAEQFGIHAGKVSRRILRQQPTIRIDGVAVQAAVAEEFRLLKLKLDRIN